MKTVAIKKFKYVQGLLYVRETLFKGEPSSEKRFEYEQPGEEPFNTSGIARVRKSKSELDSGEMLEFMTEETGRSGAGLQITRRLATDDDIRELISLWPSKKDPQDLTDVVDSSKLNETEKLRIKRIFAEVITGLKMPPKFKERHCHF